MYAIIDCNNFYASCERVFNPYLEKLPVIVLSNNDGCVIARSNEAKLLGIKMGEPAFKIKNIINQKNIQVFSTNFALYGDMSERVINTISTFDIPMEIYSIDEVFLDLSQFKRENIKNLLCDIKHRIKKWTGIPVSIGVAKTKTLAKAANYISKCSEEYNGIFVLNNFNRKKILSCIPIEKIWGIGRKNNFFLKTYGIKTAYDFLKLDCAWIRKKMNINVEKTAKELRGVPCILIDDMPSTKKSICTSRTFGTMVESLSDLERSITMYITRCTEKLRKQSSCSSQGYIFIESNRFRKDLPYYSIGKTVNFSVPTSDTGEIISYLLKELRIIYKKGFKYKKAGVVLSGIIPDNIIQQSLFDKLDRNKTRKIMKSIDCINAAMGQDTIRYASQGYTKKYNLKQRRLSASYTTRWSQLLIIKV